MNFLYSEPQQKFTGEQMEAHWAAKNFDLIGDCIIAFQGPCQVLEKYFINIKHIRKKSIVESEAMLHFVIEHFDSDLEKAFLRQKLFLSILKDKLNHRLKGDVLQRWGDNIYDGDAKLTIAAVTKTSVSTKLHIGINVKGQNAPVKTKGLANYNVDPVELAQVVMNQYKLDIRRIEERKTQTRALG